MFKAFARIFIILLSVGIYGSTNYQPTVLIKDTKLIGSLHENNEVEMFLGLPFAAPPIDDLRWEKPIAWTAENKKEIIAMLRKEADSIGYADVSDGDRRPEEPTWLNKIADEMENEKTPDQLIQLFRRCMFVARFRHKFEAKQHAQPFGHHSFICFLMCLIQLMDLDSVPQAILRNGKIFTLTSKPKPKKFKRLF